MIDSSKNLIQEELTHAGEPSVITPELMKLDSYRITSDSNIEEEPTLIRLKGVECFPRKDLTAIAGQAKSGKTGLIAMLLACCTKSGENRQVLEMERVSKDPLKVMWIDTEQSQASTQNILKNRVAKIIGMADGKTEGEETPFPEELFFVFNIRSAVVDERYDLVAEAINAYRPDLVVIDNIRDMMKDINDGVQSQKLIEGLMKMAEQYDCNITTVIHQNRNQDNRSLRGWLGTELMNKVYEVFTCQKILQKEGEHPVFCIEQSLTRKYDIDSPIYYVLNDNGLPELCNKPQTQPRESNGRYASYGKADVNTLNANYIIKNPNNSRNPWEWDLRKLFSDAFDNRALMGYQDLQKVVMQLTKIKHEKYYEKVYQMAVDDRVIRADQDRCGRVVVMMLPL